MPGQTPPLLPPKLLVRLEVLLLPDEVMPPPLQLLLLLLLPDEGMPPPLQLSSLVQLGVLQAPRP